MTPEPPPAGEFVHAAGAVSFPGLEEGNWSGDRAFRCPLRAADWLDFRPGSIKLGSAVMEHAASIFRDVQAFRLVQHYKDGLGKIGVYRWIFLCVFSSARKGYSA